MNRQKFYRYLYTLYAINIFLLSSCPMDISIEDITNMSSIEMIEYITKGVKNARVTVGIVQNGEMSFKVYGENGKERPNIEHIYEIGSVTKPITAQLFAKALSEGRINLDDQIDKFLELPAKAYYPTIRRLLTHTSGYRTEYYEGYISDTNFVAFGNVFYGMTKKIVLDRIGTINLQNREYPFKYSNFGMAVAGLVLEAMYNEDFTILMNNYLRNDLGLNNTRIYDGSGDLSNYWHWNEGNPHIAAGGILSTVIDMMIYGQMQIDENPSYVAQSHNVLTYVNAPENMHIPELSLRVDAMGLCWPIDCVNNIIWHGGGTTSYNSYLGFNKEDGIVVVVLSNIRNNYLPIWAIGAKIFKELS